MSEKRFKLIKIDDYVFQIKDIDNDLYLVAEQICDLLNEQQATINELEETNKAMYNRLKEQSEIIYQLIQKLKRHMTEKELKELIEDWGL